MALPLATALSACDLATVEDTTREPVLPPPASTDPVNVIAYPAQCWLDRSLQLAFYDETELSELAACDVAVLPMHALLSPEGEPQIRRVRQLNPDIVILGEFPILSWKDFWGSPQHRDRFPLVGPVFDMLSAHPAYTTDGERALMWSQAPMVNPWTPEGYDEELLLDLVDHICRIASQFPGVMDGFFHDYLSGRPWMQGTVSGNGDGWVDLDGDGIDSREDPDENEAWLEWQRRLLSELRARFGDGLIQIGNGKLPHDDQVVASSLNGIVYEAFPTSVWNFTDRNGFERAVDHTRPGWLTPTRGRHWSLLWDRSGVRPEFCRVSSLLTGQFYALTDLQGEVRRDRTMQPVAATPEPLVSTPVVNDGMLYTRAFAEGTARIEFAPSGGTLAAEFVPQQ